MNDSKIFHELGEYPAKDFENMMNDMPKEVVILEGKTYVDADVYDKLEKERDELKNACGKMTDIHDMYAKVQEARIEQLEKERDELKEVIKFKDERHDILFNESKKICDENVEIERERNTLKKENEKLIKTLGERDHELEVLRISYNAVKTKCDELNTPDPDACCEGGLNYEAEYNSLNEYCGQLLKENERLKHDYERLKTVAYQQEIAIKTVELIFGGEIL